MAPTKKRKWSDNDMSEALKNIKKGLSLGKASKRFGIPKQTLSDRVRKKYQTSTLGRPTKLSTEKALLYYITLSTWLQLRIL